jgi:DNA polymerase III subunit epsilon
VPTFTAIDFETANHSPESACAIGLVRVEDGVVVARESRLIRPPSRDFVFSYIHGIAWKDVAHQPVFREAWAGVRHQRCDRFRSDDLERR